MVISEDYPDEIVAFKNGPPLLLGVGKGENIIAVKVNDTGGGGGLWSNDDEVKLVTAQKSIPLAGNWKFAIEKIDDFSQKELLKKIFVDLEILTNELIELEKLNLTKLNLTTFSAETLIIESLEKLYLEDESKIEIKINEDFKISGDLHYLSTALKNLIDNALKYAISFPIIIKVDKNQISILNSGEKLSKEFEYYLKPFTQELIQRDGFGLGLSIVKKILDKHNFQLIYSYKNGFNIFKIIL